jgi:hypothetical protein
VLIFVWCLGVIAVLGGGRSGSGHGYPALFFCVEGAYTQQGRVHSRRLHPDWAARPALMSRAPHAVESSNLPHRLLRNEGPSQCLYFLVRAGDAERANSYVQGRRGGGG